MARGRRRTLVKALAAGFTAAVALMVAGLLGVVGLGLALVSPSQAGAGGAPSPGALADIPAELLAVYQEAAEGTCNMAWQVLAAVGKVESDPTLTP